MNNILKLNNVCKNYNNFSLKSVSIDVPKGVVVGFIGENGSGKTTTIKSILNLINIDSGEIEIFNKPLLGNEKEIKERVGIVLDNSFMPDILNPKEIDKIMSRVYINWDSSKYFDYINKFKLPANKEIKEYSSGMLMKLKLITALSHNPELLILDEPTSTLDPIARRDIIDIFRDFMLDENHSIFISSHITTDLESIADYIVFIKDGKIILNEEKDYLLDNYATVKCTKDEFLKLSKEDYIKYKKNKYDYEVLIKNKNEFKKKYNIKTIEKINLDELMLLYIRGE